MKKKLYITSIIIFFIDQLSKYIVINNFSYLESKVVIPSFFSLTYVKNTGGAFSILENYTFLLIIISIVILLLSVVYIKKNPPKSGLLAISYGGILGGLFGNLIDRIIYNGVIDFFDFKIFSYQWPIFNIADIAIVVSVFMIILYEVRGEMDESRERKRSLR